VTSDEPGVTTMRLTDPDLDFYVDVRLMRFEGRWLATADLAEDRPDVGSGDTPRQAIRNALRVLGEPYATEMAEGVDMVTGGPSGT
jgi:hypothetical protein